MKRKSILIVDDEPQIREYLAEVVSEYYRVFIAQDGMDALKIAAVQIPSLIILDALMPSCNGFEFCEAIRSNNETKNIPIVMLTALNTTEDRIKAFNLGADDFISKPFIPEELLARINRRLIKESENHIPQNKFQLGGLNLQFDTLSIEIDGVQYELGQTEHRILNFLLKRPGELISRQELTGHIWGDEIPSERALDPHITSLRKKLLKSRSEIKTVYGKGYCIILKEKTTAAMS